MSVIYVSGPMTGIKKEDYTRDFNTVKSTLEEQGHLAVTPLENGIPENSSYREHIKADIAMLLDCDTIFMMRGWEYSPGCITEHRIAISCAMKIIYQ